MRNTFRTVVGKSEGKRLDGRIILKSILKKWDMRLWAGFIWLRTGTSGWLL
jgi:hypothetical protein